MNKIIIYSAAYCPYCSQAKDLLDSLKLPFEELKIDADPKIMQEMLKKTGGKKTIPQIFINDKHVGGFDNLQDLVQQDKLTSYLK